MFSFPRRASEGQRNQAPKKTCLPHPKRNLNMGTVRCNFLKQKEIMTLRHTTSQLVNPVPGAVAALFISLLFLSNVPPNVQANPSTLDFFLAVS